MISSTGYFGKARIVLRVGGADIQQGAVVLDGKVMKVYEREPGVYGERGLEKGDLIKVYFYEQDYRSEIRDIRAGELVMMRIEADTSTEDDAWTGDDADIKVMNPVMFYLGYYGPVLLVILSVAFVATIAWWFVRKRRKARGVVPMDPGRERSIGASYRCGKCNEPLRLLAREREWYCDNCGGIVRLVTGPREQSQRYNYPEPPPR